MAAAQRAHWDCRHWVQGEPLPLRSICSSSPGKGTMVCPMELFLLPSALSFGSVPAKPWTWRKGQHLSLLLWALSSVGRCFTAGPPCSPTKSLQFRPWEEEGSKDLFSEINVVTVRLNSLFTNISFTLLLKGGNCFLPPAVPISLLPKRCLQKG